jgi:hypothetical protein
MVNPFQDSYEQTDALDRIDDYVDLNFRKRDSIISDEEKQMSYTKRQLENTLGTIEEYLRAQYSIEEISQLMNMDERIVAGLIQEYMNV